MIARYFRGKLMRVELETWGEAISFEVDDFFEKELKNSSWYKIFGGYYVRVGELNPATFLVTYAVLPYAYCLIAREIWKRRVSVPVLRWLWRQDLLEHERGEVIPWYWPFTKVRYSKLIWQK